MVLIIYFQFLGGYDRVECLQSTEQYIPESNTWLPAPSMRGSRGRFQIAVISDKVYAVGGSNGTTELDTVEMWDSSSSRKYHENQHKLHY